MTRKIVILNDTSTRYHHGCARVMRLLRQGLQTRGAEILATSPARHDWENDADLMGQIVKADCIVINGEGTLHDGATSAERLLRLGVSPAAKGKKLCLVNALYTHNPSSWHAYLEPFDVISARDSDSASQLSALVERQVGWLPDLSLSHPSEIEPTTRQGVLLGDSVRFAKRKALAQAAHHFKDLSFVPTKTLRQGIWRVPLLGSMLKSGLYMAYNAHPTLRPPRMEMPLTEQDYLRRIAASELHITGRFHAVCLSLLTHTPFLALSSVSGKIEKLLSDLGLGTDRVLSESDLLDLDPAPAAHAFSNTEIEGIQSALADAQNRANALFDEVVA